MQIPIWKHDSNPAIDPRDFRRSRSYCQREVSEGRAREVVPGDISQGIWLTSKQTKWTKAADLRGSPEQFGCLSANEAILNSDYRGRESEIAMLSREYEDRLDKHIAGGKKGTPRMCAVIAARVKTILSDPAFGRTVQEVCS
jgi:hypothetical protein